MPGMPPSQLAGRVQGMEESLAVLVVQPERMAPRAMVSRTSRSFCDFIVIENRTDRAG